MNANKPRDNSFQDLLKNMYNPFKFQSLFPNFSLHSRKQSKRREENGRERSINVDANGGKAVIEMDSKPINETESYNGRSISIYFVDFSDFFREKYNVILCYLSTCSCCWSLDLNL